MAAETADPPPEPRAFHVLAAHGGRLVLFGGWVLAGASVREIRVMKGK